jgi:hypothetical protein
MNCVFHAYGFDHITIDMAGLKVMGLLETCFDTSEFCVLIQDVSDHIGRHENVAGQNDR